MKQHITKTQLNELSEKGKERLRKWWIKRHLKNVDELRITIFGKGDKKEAQDNHDKKMAQREYQEHGRFLSVGMMIEFLDEKYKKNPWPDFWDDRKENRRIDEIDVIISWKDELCDALFLAVKEVLEK